MDSVKKTFLLPELLVVLIGAGVFYFTKTSSPVSPVPKNVEAPLLYIKGQVISADAAKGTVEYHPQAFDQTAEESRTATLPVGAKIYAVSDITQMLIETARKEIQWKEIKVGDTVLIVVDKNTDLSQASIPAVTLIIVRKK